MSLRPMCAPGDSATTVGHLSGTFAVSRHHLFDADGEKIDPNVSINEFSIVASNEPSVEIHCKIRLPYGYLGSFTDAVQGRMATEAYTHSHSFSEARHERPSTRDEDL